MKRIALVLLFIALPAAAQPAGGRIVARSQDEVRLERGNVVERLRLAAAPGSAAEFESFVVEVLADGTRVVRGTHRLDDRADNSSYRWTADLNARTYRVERTPLAPAGARFDAGTESTDTDEGPPSNCEVPTKELCDDHCSGSWTATVVSEDPATIDLTRTTVSGSWGIYGVTTCYWRENYTGSCWANPDTPFVHTTWFVDSCVRYFSNVQGAFHNDNWLSNSLRTYARASVTIRRVDGLGTFVDWTAAFSGESSYLLYGILEESGSNTCF